MVDLREVAAESAEGAFYLFAGGTASKLVSAAAFVLVARLLSPEEFGLYSLSLVLPSLFVVFSGWGVDSALVRFTARARADPSRLPPAAYVRVGLLFRVGLAALLSLLLFLSAEPLTALLLQRPGLADVVRVASPLVVFQALFRTTGSVFIGFERMDLRATADVMQAGGRAILSPALILLGMGIWGAVVGQVLGYAIAAMGSLILLFFRVQLRSQIHGVRRGGARVFDSMARYGFPLFLGLMTTVVLSRYHLLLMAWFVSDAEIGNYTVAVNSAALIVLATVPISTVLLPAFSRFDQTRQGDELRRMFGKAVRYSSLLVIPAVVGVILLSQPLVYAFFGSEYSMAPGLLALYTLSFSYVVLGSLVVAPLLNSQGRTRETFRIRLSNSLVGAALGTLLIASFGTWGLIFALLTAGTVSSVYGLRLVRGLFGVEIGFSSTLRFSTVCVVSGLLTYVVVTLLSLRAVWSLTLGIPLFTLLLLLLAPLSGAVHESDLTELGDMFSHSPVVGPLVSEILRFEVRLLRTKRQGSRS